jgi:hypothetical protein
MVIAKIERTIQWYGLLEIPADISALKYWRLYADLIRYPQTPYQNNRYPIPRSFFGYVQHMIGDKLYKNYAYEYPSQFIADHSNVEYFLHQSMSCFYEGMLNSFQNLGTALNLAPFNRFNSISDWTSYEINPSQFKIRLLTQDTIAKFTFEYDTQNQCPGNNVPPPPPPIPPPQTKPIGYPLPPGDNTSPTPNISPPYQGPDDNGETYNPSPVMPNFNECDKVKGTFLITRQDGVVETVIAEFYWPYVTGIVSTTINSSSINTSLIISTKGLTSNGGCQNSIQQDLISGYAAFPPGYAYVSFVIDSFEVIP